jgi:hypothetical protein
MPETEGPPVAARPRVPWWQRLVGPIRLAYLPVLITYFAYGASTITAIAILFFEKDTLGITPAEAAGISFWVALPWSTKMVAGVASDVYPILGSRRRSYLLLGAGLAIAGYACLATLVHTKAAFLAALVIVTVGYMVQDVVADALSVEVAQSDEETAQVQALGRMALLVGTISVGYLGGVLAGTLGPRAVFALASLLPAAVAAAALFVRAERPMPSAARREGGALGAAKARTILVVGLAYAMLGVVLESLSVPYAQEIVLGVSGLLIVLLLRGVGISRPVAVAAFAIFVFRAAPTVGQGYSYWAIDRLGFDQQFLGLLAQASSLLGLAGLIVFRKAITERPVSFTLFWVTVVGSLLYLPSIGLFYGANEWVGLSPRAFAFIDTTISAPLAQLSMVPMLALIARTAPAGAEATMFAIMASLMNLALSASELFTRYLNTAFAVSQHDYANLGQLMIAVGVIGLAPLLALPLLRQQEQGAARVPAPRTADA